MALAHRPGLLGTLRAYRSHIHPVFMLPALTASLFGALLAGTIDVGLAGLHALVVCAELYTAHLKDGYVDRYLRGEDEHNPLTVRGSRLGLLASTAVVFGTIALLAVVVDPVVVGLTVPGWVVAYYHAPQLDMYTPTATAGYPFGIALSICGGFYTQTGRLSTLVLTYAIVIFLVLVGIKIVDDCTDVRYDRSIGKQTVAVVVGRDDARGLGNSLMGIGLGALVVGGLFGPLPSESLLAVVVFVPVAWVAHGQSAHLATMVLIRGTYLFFALLVATAWLFGQ